MTGSEVFAVPPSECVVVLAPPDVEGVVEVEVVGAVAGCAMAETSEVAAVVVGASGANDEGDEEAVVGAACPEVVELDEPTMSSRPQSGHQLAPNSVAGWC